jgi:uncharacterized protein DUF5670
MIGTVLAVLMILWVLGVSFNGESGLIYILLVITVVVLTINLVGRRTAA